MVDEEYYTPILGEGSFQLFKRFPSFWDSFFGFFSGKQVTTEINYSESPEEADARAFSSDWLAVQGDLANAMRIIGAEYDGKQCKSE